MVMRRAEGAAIAKAPIIKGLTTSRPNIALFMGAETLKVFVEAATSCLLPINYTF